MPKSQFSLNDDDIDNFFGKTSISSQIRGKSDMIEYKNIVILGIKYRKFETYWVFGEF